MIAFDFDQAHVLIRLILLLSCLKFIKSEDSPRITTAPKDQLVVAGKVANFVCIAFGNPKPDIEWRKNGKRLVTQRFSVIDMPNGSVLRIEPVRANKDNATYECLAENGIGEPARAQATLTIFSEDEVPFGFPKFTLGPNMQGVERGRSALLPCKAEGSPEPTIYWLRDVKPIDMSNPRYSFYQGGSLQITNTDLTDQGQYECVAENSLGSAYSHPASLFVRTRAVAPYFSIPPEKVYKMLPGASINLTCVAVGSPMPFVIWKKDDIEIPFKEAKPVGRNVLNLEDVTESANYTCVANSSLGTIQAQTQIIVQALPHPPTNVRVSEMTPTSVRLTWSYDDGAEKIIYYLIQYKAKNSNQGYSEISGITSNFYTITKLTAYAEYEFILFAVNDYGKSPPSSPLFVVTGDSKSGGAPRNVQARVISFTSVFIHWEEPEQPLGQISGYKLYYTMFPNLPLSSWEIQKTANKMTTIQDLQRLATYTIRVSALTSNRGEGPLSVPVQVKTKQGVPSQPQNLRVLETTPTTAKLTWTKPFSTVEPLKGYHIYYNDTFANHEFKRDIAGVENYTLDGLYPDTLYLVWITAASHTGEGAPTPPIPVRTEQFVPEAPPQDVHVKVVDSRSLNIFWKPPPKRKQNGEITYYKILYSKIDESYFEIDENGIDAAAKNQEVKVESQMSSYFLANLEEWAVYQIKVLAGTKIGDGPASEPITIRTEEAVPGEPRNVKVTPLSSSSIKVEWQPPSNKNQNGVIRGYQIHVTESVSNNSDSFTNEPLKFDVLDGDGNLQEYNITNLQPDTLYTIQVAAITRKGDGSRSPGVQARTSGGVPTKPDILVRLINVEPYMSVEVQWSRPNRTFGKLDGYRLRYGRVDDTHREEIEIPVHESSQTVKDLDRGVRYEFRISGKNNIGWGQDAIAFIETPEGTPKAPPQNLSYRFQSPTTVVLSWDPPLVQYQNGRISGFGINFDKLTDNAPKEHITNYTRYVFSSLEESTDYAFRVRAYTKEGAGPWSTKIVFKTASDVPPAPTNVHAMATSEESIEIWWDKIPFFPTILGYQVLYTPIAVEDLDLWLNKTVSLTWSAELQGLNISTMYAIRVAAYSNQGIGRLSELITARTTPTEVPINLRAKDVSTHTITLTWRQPTVLNPIGYVITYGAHKEFYDSQGLLQSISIEPVSFTVNSSVFEFTLEDLIPCTSYQVNVTGIPPDGSFRPPAKKYVTTEIAAPKPMVRPDEIGIQDGKINVIIPQASEEYGHINHYYLVVVPTQFATKEPDRYTIEELTKTPISQIGPYISAKYAPRSMPDQFQLGDDQIYNGYCNRKLLPDQTYKIFVRAVVEGPQKSLYTSSPFSKELSLNPHFSTTSEPILNPNIGPNISQMNHSVDGSRILGIGAIVMIFFLMIMIGVAFVIINKRRQLLKAPAANETTMKLLMSTPDHQDITTHPSDPVELRRLNYQTPGMMTHPPILITELGNHIEDLKADDNLKFSQEYESIEPGQQFTWDNSNIEVNKPKNRYANVIAYDHSRVVLQPLDGIPGSDYINANYCDGYRKQNAYIATQGPLPETVGDFWRMVWEQRSACIVMMTKLEERTRIKCDQYWPSRGTETYGVMQVTLTGIEELSTYCIRTFTLQRYGYIDNREVRQFQFTAWPDHGVPDHPTPFLMFLRRIKSMNPPEAGPMIIHCSAGVGRTGCFIVIDSMIERLKYENIVDIYGHVTCLRAQRNYMVQTEDQYIFIYDSILETVISGNTEVSARNLYNHIQFLMQTISDGNITGMELEFKKIASMKTPPSKFVSANLPTNKYKNRLMNIFPYEWTRVFLQPLRGIEGSDYINASYIDGYRFRNAYIATQGPMPETTEDFWRMIWEHNSNIIVMLTKVKEMGREKCHYYWPSERSQRYLYFVVDPTTEYNLPQYILREFKITDARDGQSRTVRQFHFVDWPEQGVPKSGEGFIDFIFQIHKTKAQFGHEGPITVHCSAGVGRTGVFITLSIVLERIQNEGVIDLFQTVRTLRTQRPGMVQTEDQYQFCYRAALEYISTFDYTA